METIIILFGPPGSGKGTQAKELAKKFHLKHISTGDLFRDNIKNNTELGKKVESILKEGQLVPDEITLKMLKEELINTKRLGKDIKGVILDGFPRNAKQAEDLDQLLEKQFNKNIDIVLALKVPDEVTIKRIQNRALESNRADDENEEIIKNRLEVYYNETEPVSHYYKKKGKWADIDGVGEISKITDSLSNIIKDKVFTIN